MTAAPREAWWWTERSLARRVLDELLAADRDLDLGGRFGSAVQITHEQGLDGEGQRVAILDSGFDLSLVSGADVDTTADTASRDDEGAVHGTVVTLLVQRVAPRAALLLADVSERRGERLPDLRRAADGIRAASDWGADVIVCSCGWTTDAELTDDDFGLAVDLSASPDAFVAALEGWARQRFKIVRPGGCSSSCELCDAIAELPPGGPLVVAAAGNSAAALGCPAVHDRVIACGFNATAVTLGGGSATERHGLPGFEQSRTLDIVIDELAGFRGTSFAAPLVGGFAALGARAEFEAMRVGSAAANLVAARHSVLEARAESGASLPDGAMESVSAGYRMATLALGAPRHLQHGQPPAPGYPCAMCSFAYDMAWENWGRLLVSAGLAVEAEQMLVRAAQLAPRSGGILMNLGAARRALAAREPRHSRRLGVLTHAVAAYEEAARHGRPDVSYLAWNEALQPPIAPIEVPDGPLSDVRAPQQPAGMVIGYAGAAADDLLLANGWQALRAGALDDAARMLAAVQAPEGTPFEDASVGRGLVHALRGELADAARELAAATGSGSEPVRLWAIYNLALVDEARGRLPDAQAGFASMASTHNNVPYVDVARICHARGDAPGERAARALAIAGVGVI
jgi:tetratricopeptide (TPR) repeat protein